MSSYFKRQFWRNPDHPMWKKVWWYLFGWKMRMPRNDGKCMIGFFGIKNICVGVYKADGWVQQKRYEFACWVSDSRMRLLKDMREFASMPTHD